jgi:ATP-binding cassette, subfamily B, bacterial MsbA
MPIDLSTSQIKTFPLLKRSLVYFLPYKMRIFISLISMLFVAASTTSIAFLVKPALDEIFINRDARALLYIPPLIVLVFFIKGVFTFLKDYLLNSCGLRVLEQLRNELHGKFMTLPVSFYDENRTGMLMSRILNDVNEIKQSLPSLIQMVTHLLTMIGLLGVIFYRDPFLATIAVLVLPLSFYPFFSFGRKLRKLSRKNQIKIADITSFLQELISGIKTVKAFATEGREKKRFAEENSRLVKISIKQTVIDGMSSPIMEFIGAIGIGLVVWYGGRQVIEGHATPGTFFSFMTALVMLYDPIKKLNKANLIIQRALAGAERVFQILDLPDKEHDRGGPHPFVPPLMSVQFENVTMAYGENGTAVLKDVTFAVHRGEKVALVGPSGSGKTTLVNLIPRFYAAQSGTILLNGLPIENYALESLRRSIGIVSQDPFLFNTTVRENIAYGQEHADQEQIERAARAAYAHDFILELPEGYDTVIGERGVKLSGGQKQRVTIARALLKDPPLLILDEATSALDTQAERIVQQALENLMKERTSIVIAHRLSTILSADKILVLSRGSIVGMGTHDQLLKSSPLYMDLYTMQFRNERSHMGQTLS